MVYVQNITLIMCTGQNYHDITKYHSNTMVYVQNTVLSGTFLEKKKNEKAFYYHAAFDMVPWYISVRKMAVSRCRIVNVESAVMC